MRIHFNLSRVAATEAIFVATEKAAVFRERYTAHGSRTHTCAYDIILSGHSNRRINAARYRDENAASWDQWGIFLGHLFDVDPELKTTYYENAKVFHRVTNNRFNPRSTDAVLSVDHPDYKRTSHRWVFDGLVLLCEGHGPKNKRVPCEAVLRRP